VPLGVRHGGRLALGRAVVVQAGLFLHRLVQAAAKGHIGLLIPAQS